MKIRFILFLFVAPTLSMIAQTTNPYSEIDRKVLQMSDSSTHSTQSIARFICNNFSTPDDRVRAIYCWVAKNIQYDVKNMFSINLYENQNETIDRVLKNRKGVCMSYASLFNDIANKSGVKACVVFGYTKQNGSVDYVPHAWVAASVNSEWYLFDPCWGAGYIAKSKFVSQISNIYFKIKPEDMVKSHMPFDYQWQLLDHPISYQKFNQIKFVIDPKEKFINFKDTIMNYEKLTEEEQLVAVTRRMEDNGGAINSILFDRLQYNKREIEYIHNKLISGQYTEAVDSYNTSVSLLNEFINYRNKKFTPIKPDSELKLMLDTIETSLNRSKKHIASIKNPDLNTVTSLMQLNKSVEEITLNLNEQKAFLKKYLSTAKIFRKTVFYKFSWLGMPVN
jgi:Uncharacterized protein involved in cytokinesis, contains TGc (transglutaminase/protease-like) domain